MGYQSLEFNGMRLLAYMDTPTGYELKEKDVIFCMPLDMYFEVTSEKLDPMKLRDDGYKKIRNTQLKNSGVSKFRFDKEELYIERKTHLLLKSIKPE